MAYYEIERGRKERKKERKREGIGRLLRRAVENTETVAFS